MTRTTKIADKITNDMCQGTRNSRCFKCIRFRKRKIMHERDERKCHTHKSTTENSINNLCEDASNQLENMNYHALDWKTHYNEKRERDNRD